jgi:hypothetical protein
MKPLLSTLITLASLSLTASVVSAIPTTTWDGVEIPNWHQLSFADLPAIQENGSFPSTPEINNMAGYDMSRTWTSGQNPPEFLKLGDFTTSFKLQNFSLDEITSLVGNDPNNLSLKDFGIIPDQTLEGLVNAIPDLAATTITSIPPINHLLTTQLGATFNPNQTLGELLNNSPMTGTLALGQIDLSPYKLDTIPGITNTPIGNFENWQNSFISEIPGLPDVSFSQFPGGIAGSGTDVGTADLILKNVEQKRTRTISGSDKQGFTVPCQTNCAHIELAGSPKIMGRQWISGKYQQVKGGFGILSQANGGNEPTGIHPFGEAFKLVLWDVNQNESSVSTQLFFRICKRGVPDLGCTPYFIGGIPFMTFDETMPIFLGKVEELPTTPEPEPHIPASSTGSSPSNPSTPDKFTTPSTDCQSPVNLDALFDALSSIQANPDSIGEWTCDPSGNCGRGLGASRYMSYRDDVRSLISGKPGGTDFLAKLDSQETVTGDELLLFFPPEDQQRLFNADISQLIDIAQSQIDPTTQLPFTGDRLIERVAQMHFGGASIPVDSTATDINGTLTVQDYGTQVNQRYQDFHKTYCP